MEQFIYTLPSVKRKVNDGIYVNEKAYNIRTKTSVLEAYLAAVQETTVGKPCMRTIAERAKVLHAYIYKVVKEYKNYGYLLDPVETSKRVIEQWRGRSKISPEVELHLLALRYEDDRRPLYHEILKVMELDVLTNTIDHFFKTRFDFAGKL